MSKPTPHNRSDYYWNQFSLAEQNGMEYYVYLEDTTGNRHAAYLGYVYVDTFNDMVHGRTAYGKIGNNLKHNDEYSASFSGSTTREGHLQIAKQKVMEKIRSKTAKNYEIKADLQVTKSIPRNAPTALPLSSLLPMSIGPATNDFPIHMEYSNIDWSHDLLIKDENVVFERHPQRMRMLYVLIESRGVGLYNMDGSITGAIEYDKALHYPSKDFTDIVEDGVLFTGHMDGSNHIVVQRYLGHALSKKARPKLTWAQQKSISTLILNTLYNDKEDIYDKNLPIYCADYVVDENDKEDMINNPSHGYAINVAFYDPHKPVEAINFLER